MNNPTHQATHAALSTIRTYWTASANPPRDTTPTGHTPPRSRPPAHHPLVRADVTHTLTFWTRALTGHRPDTLTEWLTDTQRDRLDLADVYATAAFLQDHLHVLDEWGYLEAASKDFRVAAGQLRDLVDQPDKDRPALGPCHLTHDGRTPTSADRHVPRCQGTVRAVPIRDPKTGVVTYEDGLCTGCRSSAVIDWWRTRWGLDQKLVTTRQLVDELGRHGVHAAPATVRWWLHKGIICASGATPAGDRLYDVAAVVFALGKRGTQGATVGASGSRTPETAAGGRH